jgi:DNA mismatch repair protein MutL
MREIKKLSDSAINRIAAGEVVDRPASVIKELVENSIDAGATSIEVRTEAAGKNYISILDNGYGMSEEDIKLAIQRHTTSKLKEDDISNIEFFGFRGEALPTIASVSEMIISSNQTENDFGISCYLVDGEIIKSTKINIPRGTKIDVKNLFYSTPARLKFLKSDKTEQSACIDVIKRIAISYPNISFKMICDGKEQISYIGTKSLEDRIKQVMGSEFFENSSAINLIRDDYIINGYTSIPTYNKSSSSDQFLYVNNRPVKDKLLSVALKVAYQDYLSKDRNPISVVLINTNPRYIDVNVHPAKTEIRFREASEVRAMLISAIKDALFKSSNSTSSIISSKLVNQYSEQAAKTSYLPDNSSNNFEDKKYSFANYNKISYQKPNFSNLNRSYIRPSIFDQIENLTPIAKSEPEEEKEIIKRNAICEDEKHYLGAAIAQFHSTYIISQTKDGIVIVDQHAAHERLVYEKLKKDFLSKQIPSQRLVIPAIIEFSDSIDVDNLTAKITEFSKFGLVIQKLSENAVVVREVPGILGEFDVTKLIKDLADDLKDMGENIALQELIEHVTETYACHYSIRAGRSLSITEMNDLLREMESTPFSGQCNHGRPTYVKLSLNEIEKLFGRK